MWWKFSVLTDSCVPFFLDWQLNYISHPFVRGVAIITEAWPIICEPFSDTAVSACLLYFSSANGIEKILKTRGEQNTEWKEPFREIFLCFNFPSHRSWVWRSKRIVKIFFLDMAIYKLFSLSIPLLHDPVIYVLLEISYNTSLDTDYVSFYFTLFV